MKDHRLLWVDHLRTFIVVLVVVVHACVTYSHVGSWYVFSQAEPGPLTKVGFMLVEAHAQAFFMGTLFFFAGYFAHFSLQKRGARDFLRERFTRLGLPALLFMLVIHPFILLGLNPWRAHFPPPAQFYLTYIASGRFLGSTGPLWFALALLLFCVSLVVGRRVSPVGIDRSSPFGPSHSALLVFGIGLVVTTFLVRLVQPIGSSILNFQLCFFPQYIAAFIVGLIVARKKGLRALAESTQARHWGRATLIGSPIALLLLIIAAQSDGDEGIKHLMGGLHGWALAFAVWEQLTGLGLALGLMAVFSRWLNYDVTFLRRCSDRSFGIYVLHTPVLIALTMAFRSVEAVLHPYLLTALVAIGGLLISYGLADIATRTPVLRRFV